jgi:hypothetical protein
MKNKYDEFNVDIYRNCNMDLKHYNDVDLLNHFNNHGKNENRIFSKIQLYKPQALINNDLMIAKKAVCLIFSLEKYSHEFKNILIKLNEISDNSPLDIYLSVKDDNINYATYHGLSRIAHSIHYIVDIIQQYELIDVGKYNFYLGFNLQRNYQDVIFI